MKADILDESSYYSLWSIGQELKGKYFLGDLYHIAEEVELSFLYEKTKIQDSYSFRLQKRAFYLAQYLIDDKGKVDVSRLQTVTLSLEQESFLFFPSGHNDSIAAKHMLFVLKKLQEDQSFSSFFQKFRPPLCHTWAEELVLASIGIFHSTSPTESQLKRSVLAALLTSLRQNVGSCFATAPAILIQQEQPEKLLSDLYELLMTGKLKRTFLGIENSVPLSPSSGSGDLYRKVLLTEELCFSPGLYAALQAADVVPEESDFQRRKQRLFSVFSPFFGREESVALIDLIHGVLLLHFGLTEEDLIRYRENQRSFLKSKEFLMGVKKGETSAKNQLCEKFFLCEKKAKTAFKACIDHPLLKAWEFTIASFSEIKMEFSRFNMYSSLGFQSEEKGGIGKVIYQALQSHLEIDQKKVEEYDVEYQIAYDQVRATESLLKNASTESDARRLQAELTSRFYHMKACLELRDNCYANVKEYSTFYTNLFKEYDRKFPEYFQEIYDADLRDSSFEEYEDSPAGFRLVYKHGRSNAFLWTLIYSAEEYIDCLVDFFLLVEPQIAAEFSWELAPKILRELTMLIVDHLRSLEFLDSALQRVKLIHEQRGESGFPWAYVSGGSMTILLQTYYKRQVPIFEESRKVESPTDLLMFVLDTLKSVPLDFENKKLLMSSPSHAFTLIPSFDKIAEGWKSDLYTYTWIRDQVVLPGKRFYENITLSLKEQSFLVEEFAKQLPLSISHRLHKVPLMEDCSIPIFRDLILENLDPYRLEDLLDSFLYMSIPIIPGSNWKQWVTKLLFHLKPLHLDSLLDQYPDEFSDFITARKIQDLAKAFYLLSTGNFSFSFDLHKSIHERAIELKICPPEPILFADTNWLQFYFGFVVNPGTYQLELWRLEPSFGVAHPMSSWGKWLTQSNTASWNICAKPFEYS